MAKPVILVTGTDLTPQAVAMLKNFELIYVGKTAPKDLMLSLCRQHNPVAILVRYGGVDGDVMDAAPNLKVISKHGVGLETIDIPAAAQRGIAVRAALGSNSAAVAEHAMALLLVVTKSIVPLDARMRGGHWDKATHKSVELSGRTIGLIGLGAIGLRFARMCEAMNLRVLGYDPYAKDLPSYVQSADLETIWRESDFISLHCPLTAENTQLINASTLSQCKRGVVVINTARGGLIHEADLLLAIHSGQVGGAGLDSFAIEPFPYDETGKPAQHPFMSAPNTLVLSPHVGGVTADAFINMGVGAARNILDVLAA